MRSLASLLTAALLVAVPATLADAQSEPAQGADVEAAGTARQSQAQPRISNRVAVSKPRRKRGKQQHPKKSGPPSSAPTTTPPATTTPPGQLLFGANFDGSFRPWADVQSLSGRATISTAHPFAGSGAGRFEVQQGDVEPQTGDERSEVSGPKFSAGQDIFVRDEIRVPADNSFQGPWELINQLHETDWGGSPGIATFLESSRQIRFGAGDGFPRYWQGPVLEPERWYTLVYRVYLSQDPNQGFVEVWFDGVQQTLSNGATRMYGETIQTGQTYIKAGIYRSGSSSGVSVVEHDSIAVGTSYAVVMAF